MAARRRGSKMATVTRRAITPSASGTEGTVRRGSITAITPLQAGTAARQDRTGNTTQASARNVS